MPGRNGMGPRGRGPTTGRGLGRCGGGGGWGHRNRFHETGLTGWQRAEAGWPSEAGPPPAAPFAPETQEARELEAMRQESARLGRTIVELMERIDELEARAGDKASDNEEERL